MGKRVLGGIPRGVARLALALGKRMEAYSLFGALITLGGLATMIVYAWKQPAGLRMTTLAACVLLALAAATVGALLGFTFGIPKTVANASETGAVSRFAGNTNFDQISDWLTKILVGAGLVELYKIGGFFQDITRTLQPYLGSAAPAVIPTIIVTYSITGFLTTYLWARLYLIAQLQETELVDNPEFNLALMLANLYTPKPRGFIRVLEIARETEELLAGEGRYWVYRACAYGQKHAWQRALPNRDDREIYIARTGALEAVNRALAANAPMFRPMLRDLWKAEAGSRDNDLASFRDDPEFEKLLAESPSADPAVTTTNNATEAH